MIPPSLTLNNVIIQALIYLPIGTLVGYFFGRWSGAWVARHNTLGCLWYLLVAPTVMWLIGTYMPVFISLFLLKDPTIGMILSLPVSGFGTLAAWIGAMSKQPKLPATQGNSSGNDDSGYTNDDDDDDEGGYKSMSGFPILGGVFGVIESLFLPASGKKGDDE